MSLQMIDFTKIQIPDKCGNTLLQNRLLSFERNVNEDTGELDISEERTAEYKNMKFKIYPSGRVILMGSWHKFAKEGYNSSDFNIRDFRLAVFDFCKSFDLNPNELRLLQFEAGVNIVPPMQIRSVLRAFVCSSDGKVSFSQMRSKTGSSLGVEMYRNEYGIKVYDKSKQYKLSNDLMRYEIKFTSSKLFRREFGVEYLSDLMLLCKWLRISMRVENSVKDLILNEPTFEISGLSSVKKNFIVQSSVSNFWKELNRRQRMRSKIKMKKMVEQYARSDLKSAIQTRVREKLLQLTAI